MQPPEIPCGHKHEEQHTMKRRLGSAEAVAVGLLLLATACPALAQAERMVLCEEFTGSK